MFAGLTGPQRAATFYVVAFGLAVVIGLFAGTFGELTALVTMLTPAAAVVIMMLLTRRLDLHPVLLSGLT